LANARITTLARWFGVRKACRHAASEETLSWFAWPEFIAAGAPLGSPGARRAVGRSAGGAGKRRRTAAAAPGRWAWRW